MVINDIKEDGNAFGEFLFVTVTQSRQKEGRPSTFCGLGYHEQRERWISEYWRWFESYRDVKEMDIIPKRRVIGMIKERENFVRTAAASEPTPSTRAQLYDLMAEITDEDGALTELEDFGWMFLGNLDDDDKN